MKMSSQDEQSTEFPNVPKEIKQSCDNCRYRFEKGSKLACDVSGAVVDPEHWCDWYKPREEKSL